MAATASGHHEPDFMAAADWGPAYGVVSDVLHARNPFKAPRVGPHSMKKQFQQITESLWWLLKAHTLNTGTPGCLLLGLFDETNVQVATLTKVSDIPKD